MFYIIDEVAISKHGAFNQKGPSQLLSAFRHLFVTVALVFVCTIVCATGAFANYLDMTATPIYQSMIQVQMNYNSGKTYRVEWGSGSAEFPASSCYGAPNTCLYTIGNLQCHTVYEVRAKWKGRAWQYSSVRTNCGVPCPHGGWFDGANCQIGQAPAGTTAFIWGGNYYYTPRPPPARCPYPNSWFDSANCYVQAIPSGTQPFIWQNYWYYKAWP
jgi:hypothetical protein